MGCDGWAWSPGNISTRKKYLQVLLFSMEFQVFLFPCPLCNMHVLTKGRIQSQQYIFFLYMFVSDGTVTRFSICNAQNSVLNVMNTLYQNLQ